MAETSGTLSVSAARSRSPAGTLARISGNTVARLTAGANGGVVPRSMFGCRLPECNSRCAPGPEPRRKDQPTRSICPDINVVAGVRGPEQPLNVPVK
jgi:hypothetical protein